MDQERKALRFGVTVILLAAVWHWAAGGGWAPVAEFLAEPSRAAFLLYLGTGRVVHPEANAQTEAAVPLVATLPPETEPVLPEPLSFSDNDVKYYVL